MFSEKTTKINEIFTVDLTLCSKCQIGGEDFFNFLALKRKHELKISDLVWFNTIVLGVHLLLENRRRRPKTLVHNT